jgi:pilus assembly protein CpaE
MIKFALQASEEKAPEPAADTGALIAPVPRVAIQSFCDTAAVAAVINAAADDRRLAKAQMKVQTGGMEGAAEAYRTAPTPNVIVIESAGTKEQVIAGLDTLAEYCDPGTKVVVIGRHNDIHFYRDLIARGVSDYLIAPITVIDLVRALSGLYVDPASGKLGRTLAVIGAKGGVGASTIAHNIAWALARDLNVNTVLADLDLPFGTAGLDFNQDPPQGVADAIFSPERVDTAFVDRLLSKCTDQLSLLGAPATLDKSYDFTPDQFEPLLEVMRGLVPCTVLDVPHVWNGWTRRVLLSADEILIVAGPDLANLRNTKNMLDLLKLQRPNDSAARYLINGVNVPKRPEIKPADFAKALEQEPLAVIPFEPNLFGTAANNGQMISELDPKHRIAETFLSLAQGMTGRIEQKKSSRSLLAPLFEKLKRKQG